MSSSTCRSTSMRRASSRPSRCAPIRRPREARRSRSTATNSCSSPPDWTASRSTRPISKRARRAFCCAGRPEARVHAHDRDAPRSGGQHQAHGPLSLGLGLLHAMRGGRLSPHHLFSRSPRRALDLSRAARGGPGGGAGAAVQRQSRKRGRSGDARAPLRHLARSAQEAVLPVRAGRRRSRPYRGFVRHRCRARRSRSRSMSSTAARSARITRWTRSSARWPGTSRLTGANTISTFSTSSPSPISIWARWRTRASTSSTTNTSSRRRRRRPTTTTPISRA